MAVKVIEHGNTYQEIECPKCKAKIGYNKKDIVETYDDDQFSYCCSITCPDCDKEIILRMTINGEVTNYGGTITRFKPGGLV